MKKTGGTTTPSKLRIIGGQWRSRKIFFYAEEGLRPTPDRVRETVFNWLAPYIQGARCLDGFAGSGALGFEALSRGAKSVVMMDRSAQVIKTLRENAEILKADNITLQHGEFGFLVSGLTQKPFDIIFIDPPFHQDLLLPSLQALEKNHCLTDNTLVYVEAERAIQNLPLSKSWKILRQQQAGDVSYFLLQYSLKGA
jgi:16S rRNA (guanine966-N2)-methyltransferase